MALQTKTVYVDLTKFPAAKIPATGTTVPTAASALGTPDITKEYTWNLLSSESTDTTQAAGYNDLFNTELKADIDAFIAANTGLGIDTVATNVSYNARITGVTYGAGTDMFKTNSLVNFVVTFELKVYVSAL